MRVGLVGLGRWGTNVLRDLVSLDARVSVADVNPARHAAALSGGAEIAVGSIHELPRCDGYLVVTPAPTHRAVCEELLKRGVPVFVEKPPCTDLVDVEALARVSDGRLYVMHKWRYHPGVIAMAALVSSGRLGEPTLLETTRTGPELMPPDTDVMWHLGVHDLSIGLSVLGALPPVREAVGVRDAAGRVTQCRATLAGPTGPEFTLRLGAEVPDRVRRIRVVGTQGSAELASPDTPFVRMQTQGLVQDLAIPAVLPLERELSLFLEHLAGGPPPISDATTAVVTARVLRDLGRHVASGP